MNYKFLLISSDIILTSSQGVRYTSLFSNKCTGEKNICLVYSSRSDNLEGWETYTVRQIKFPFLYNSFNRIMRRIIYPDVYIFRLEQCKRKLKGIFFRNTFENVVIRLTPFSLLLLGKWIKTEQSFFTIDC